MIKIISDIEKEEYNPKYYNLDGNVLNVTNFEFTYNNKIYNYVKHEIKNNENGKKIYENYNILNNNIQRFDKNEFTKEIYESIMLSSELYDLMPDVLKYFLKYEDLGINKNDLER